MKVLIVGPRWIGEWVQGVQRAALNLNVTPVVFYYDTPFAMTVERTINRVNRLAKVRLMKMVLPGALMVSRAWEDQMNRRLVYLCRRTNPDVVILLKGETIKAKTLEAIRFSNRHLISWWFDNPLQYEEVKIQLEFLTAIFVFDRYYFGPLKDCGARRIEYLPCAFDPALHRPQIVDRSTRDRLECTVGFVGSFYPERGRLLEAMQGLEVGIWGWDWEYSRELKSFPERTWRAKSLAANEAAKVYQLAQICPNLHHSQTRDGGLNTRTFEIPASGGFELVDQPAGMDEHFEIGKELITFSSPEHFRELTDYYLAHPEQRQEIVEHGRSRVLRDHTYQKRLEQIFERLDGI